MTNLLNNGVYVCVHKLKEKKKLTDGLWLNLAPPHFWTPVVP